MRARFDSHSPVVCACLLDYLGWVAPARRLAECPGYPSALGSPISACRLADHDTQSASCRSKLAAEDRGLGFSIFPLAITHPPRNMVWTINYWLRFSACIVVRDDPGAFFRYCPCGSRPRTERSLSFIRHPMYLGELISLAGALIGDPSIWNIILINILLLTLLLRIRWEELVVSDYGSYARQVRWRMIPGLW